MDTKRQILRRQGPTQPASYIPEEWPKHYRVEKGTHLRRELEGILEGRMYKVIKVFPDTFEIEIINQPDDPEHWVGISTIILRSQVGVDYLPLLE